MSKYSKAKITRLSLFWRIYEDGLFLGLKRIEADSEIPDGIFFFVSHSVYF